MRILFLTNLRSSLRRNYPLHHKVARQTLLYRFNTLSKVNAIEMIGIKSTIRAFSLRLSGQNKFLSRLLCHGEFIKAKFANLL